MWVAVLQYGKIIPGIIIKFLADKKIVEIITQPFIVLAAKYKKTSGRINGTYIEQQRTEGYKLMLLLDYLLWA